MKQISNLAPYHKQIIVVLRSYFSSLVTLTMSTNAFNGFKDNFKLNF